MPYTMEDFERDYIIKHIPRLTRQELKKVLRSLPRDKQMEIRQYLDHLAAEGQAQTRNRRRNE